MKQSLTVLVTGAAGQIGYSLLPRLVSGEIFGPNIRVNLRLVEIPPMVERLRGVVMELEDCAFVPLGEIWVGSDIEEAASGVDWALLVGSVPRGIVYKGKKIEERSELLKINGDIFVGQGSALGKHASPDCKVLVVGNPANTNCLIGHHHAQAPGQLWAAMTALDAHRASSMLAARASCHSSDVQRMIIWGNHSPTMYADADNAMIGGRSAAAVIDDPVWLQDEFLPAVQQRGKAVIAARGASSAFSAAHAALCTVARLHRGTSAGDCLSVALRSTGQYGIPAGIFCGFPVQVSAGEASVIPGLELSETARAHIDASVQELQEEREAVVHLLSL